MLRPVQRRTSLLEMLEFRRAALEGVEAADRGHQRVAGARHAWIRRSRRSVRPQVRARRELELPVTVWCEDNTSTTGRSAL